jgi:hypothetical protein
MSFLPSEHPEEQAPSSELATVGQRRDAESAEIIESLRRDASPMFLAVKRLRRGAVDRETARMIAVALLEWPPLLSEWECEFLNSIIQLREDPTHKQQMKLREIMRNPMPCNVIERKLRRLYQQGTSRRQRRDRR